MSTNPIPFLVGELARIREVRSMVEERVSDGQRRLVDLDMRIIGLGDAIRRLGGVVPPAARSQADPSGRNHTGDG